MYLRISILWHITSKEIFNLKEVACKKEEKKKSAFELYIFKLCLWQGDFESINKLGLNIKKIFHFTCQFLSHFEKG